LLIINYLLCILYVALFFNRQYTLLYNITVYKSIYTYKSILIRPYGISCGLNICQNGIRPSAVHGLRPLFLRDVRNGNDKKNVKLS